MKTFSRRAFTQNLLGSLFAFSLVRTVSKADLLTGSIKPIAHQWAVEMERVTRALREGRIRPSQWQQQIESLLVRVDISDLLRSIDYERLSKTAVFPADHESAEDIDFSKIEGLPSQLSFAPYFYAMKKDIAIVPHGHRNMASMHMVLKGQAQSWQYDRVRDEPRYLIINPTKDKLLVPGDVSTISDERDNIHWFKAMTEPVFMFNIGVFGIDHTASFTGRDYIDPANGEKIKGGFIRARRIDMNEAYKLYGKS